MNKLLPEGFPYPSSTLISGPGGTGKPLVEFAFVASWLRHGGSVIAMPLQYPTMEFVKTTMNKLYNLDLENYYKKIAYIQFDPSIKEYKKLGNNILKANLLKYETWNKTIEIAETMVEKSNMGILVFGAALNLLLFSPTYKESTIKNIENILKNDKNKTYIFSVSTSVFADKIKIWENAADNLLFTRMEKEMKLFLEISKMLEVKFLKKETQVSISKEMFKEIKSIAETTRKKIIPIIRKV
ncbi:MAG TPA: hypothetical protein VJ926_03425 [Patescibacteria group bacterium]|nr:hypothetical protein [Patescibacteria group bacterium]